MVTFIYCLLYTNKRVYKVITTDNVMDKPKYAILLHTLKTTEGIELKGFSKRLIPQHYKSRQHILKNLNRLVDIGLIKNNNGYYYLRLTEDPFEPVELFLICFKQMQFEDQLVFANKYLYEVLSKSNFKKIVDTTICKSIEKIRF